MIQALDSLQNRHPKTAGLGLICGRTGLGKTESVQWYSVKYEIPYLRARAAWSLKFMLQELCYELRIEPESQINNIVQQLVDHLTVHPQMIIVDECDYLTKSGRWRLIETIRDIHDESNSPFVFVGEGNIRNKFAKQPRIARRITQTVEFKPMTAEEIGLVTFELTGLNIDDGVADQLVKLTEGCFGYLVVAIPALEKMAHTYSQKNITKQMVDHIKSKVIKKKAA
jgi:DNA transposition AAA+ family ATPase